jgi:hypothetical protein
VMDPQERERAESPELRAAHEAAHAVIALALEMDVLAVTVNAATVAVCASAMGREDAADMTGITLHTCSLDPIDNAAVSIAGCVWEHVHEGVPMEIAMDGARDDVKAFVAHAPTAEQQEAACERATVLIDLHADRIRAVARFLLRWVSLDRAQICRIAARWDKWEGADPGHVVRAIAGPKRPTKRGKPGAGARARRRFFRGLAKLQTHDAAWEFCRRGPLGCAPGGGYYTRLALYLRTREIPDGATSRERTGYARLTGVLTLASKGR